MRLEQLHFILKLKTSQKILFVNFSVETYKTS